jgi:RND family efflux transporter MFP subunit
MDVEKGQVLARLDDRDYQAASDAAEAELKAARSEAERAQALYDRQATSKQRLDVALANLQVAESAFERAAKALSDTQLRAPMAGVVARVYVEDIVNVQAKESILLLQDLSRFKVVVDVPETVAVLVDPRMPEEERLKTYSATVYLTTGSKRGFPAEFVETAKVANPTTRTFSATLVFEGPEDINILPGMTARLQVDLTELVRPEGTWFQVPSHAVAGRDDKQPYVWEIDPEAMTASRVEVRVGRLSGGLVEVRSDELSPGSLVAASGLLHLREGMQVREFNP